MLVQDHKKIKNGIKITREGGVPWKAQKRDRGAGAGGGRKDDKDIQREAEVAVEVGVQADEGVEEDNNRAHKQPNKQQPFKSDQNNEQKRGMPALGAVGQEIDKGATLIFYLLLCPLA